MKWDITGRKKLLEKINLIGQRQDAIISDISDLKAEVKALANEINSLAQSTAIPVYDPKIRDAEDVYKEEKKQEKEYTNMFRN